MYGGFVLSLHPLLTTLMYVCKFMEYVSDGVHKRAITIIYAVRTEHASRLSKVQKTLPIQFLGPAENGINANGWRPWLFSGRKRSGSNSSGAGHTSGFL